MDSLLAITVLLVILEGAVRGKRSIPCPNLVFRKGWDGVFAECSGLAKLHMERSSSQAPRTSTEPYIEPRINPIHTSKNVFV